VCPLTNTGTGTQFEINEILLRPELGTAARGLSEASEVVSLQLLFYPMEEAEGERQFRESLDN
jgi:hypothetical protein